MKTEILKIKGDWAEVVDDCRATVGKEPLGREPSRRFKRGILMAEHSPIRDISFKWKWDRIKSWIATHWVRHKWECLVKTQRTDRTGVNRDDLPQATLVTFTGEANVQHLIDTMRKRLCYQASPETREYAEDLKATITEIDPEIGRVLVPNCIYRGGCPEMQSCNRWRRFTIDAREHDAARLEETHLDDLQARYDAYAEFLDRERGGQA
jgi:hypothetical protein